jgi:hypothetical protein
MTPRDRRRRTRKTAWKLKYLGKTGEWESMGEVGLRWVNIFKYFYSNFSLQHWSSLSFCIGWTIFRFYVCRFLWWNMISWFVHLTGKKMKANMHVENQIWWAIGTRIFPALLIKMDHHASTWGPPRLSWPNKQSITPLYLGYVCWQISINVLFVIVVTTKLVTLCTFSVVFHLREQLQLWNWFKKLFCCAMQVDRFRW